MKIIENLIKESHRIISYHLVSSHLLFPDLFIKMCFLLFFSVIREELPFSGSFLPPPTPLILILELSLVLNLELSYNFLIILVLSVLLSKWALAEYDFDLSRKQLSIFLSDL